MRSVCAMEGRRKVTKTDRLTEIEARLKAATPGPWHLAPMEGSHGLEMWIETEHGGGLPVAKVCGSPIDRELIVHAPADLALLAKLVREVAGADCEKCFGTGLVDSGDCGHSYLCHCTPPFSAPCDGIVCRIRRQLDGVGR